MSAVILLRKRGACRAASRVPCRHFTDAVLTAVVALCTAENDVIHAAYLAIALLLFRRRDALQSQGNALFKWLPIYNFLVMLVTLAYQAPLPAFSGGGWESRFARVGLARSASKARKPDVLVASDSPPRCCRGAVWRTCSACTRSTLRASGSRSQPVVRWRTSFSGRSRACRLACSRPPASRLQCESWPRSGRSRLPRWRGRWRPTSELRRALRSSSLACGKRAPSGSPGSRYEARRTQWQRFCSPQQRPTTCSAAGRHLAKRGQLRGELGPAGVTDGPRRQGAKRGRPAAPKLHSGSPSVASRVLPDAQPQSGQQPATTTRARSRTGAKHTIKVLRGSSAHACEESWLAGRDGRRVEQHWGERATFLHRAARVAEMAQPQAPAARQGVVHLLRALHPALHHRLQPPGAGAPDHVVLLRAAGSAAGAPLLPGKLQTPPARLCNRTAAGSFPVIGAPLCCRRFWCSRKAF